MKYALGLDIGGTKIACGLINDQGEVLVYKKVKSNVETAETMFGCVCAAIDETLAEVDIPKEQLVLGAGVPGLVDAKNGIAVMQNNLPWGNFPFVKRIKERYPEFSSIIIDNDVCVAAYAEWKKSELAAPKTLSFFTASTGIACASLTNGDFIRGKGFSGEVGLLPIQTPDGLATLEDLIGGNNFAHLAGQLMGRDDVTTKELFEGYFAKRKPETTLVKEWIHYAAIGIYTIIAVLDPDKLVLGGSVLKLNPEILPVLKEEIKKLMLPVQYDRLETIELSTYDNNSGLIGSGLRAIDA